MFTHTSLQTYFPWKPSCLLLMFYRQGSFAGRIVPTEASAAYQPQVGYYKSNCFHTVFNFNFNCLNCR